MKYLVFFLFIFLPSKSSSQELESHQWNNRLLLIISENQESSIMKHQLDILNDVKEINERKLIIYSVLPGKYKLENDHSSKWVKGSKLFKKYNSENNKFKVVLIGLDGSLKLNQNKLLHQKTLFSIIDSMPMRRRELKGKNK